MPTDSSPRHVRVRTFVPGVAPVERDVPVQGEDVLAIVVEGGPAIRVACSDGCLTDLVAGRLLTEGLIGCVDHIEALRFSPDRRRCEVRLAHTATLRRPTPVKPIAWTPEQVFCLAGEFERCAADHQVTRGTHSCHLARAGEPLLVRRDIGRHNALDKALGAALLRGVDLVGCMLFTSGRVPADMVAKAVLARLPVLVAKAVATDRAIELARELGLTLITRATSASFDLVSEGHDLSGCPEA